MEKLARTPGEYGTSLADETTVVVLSEMGRTPSLNAQNGKDHHPITSCMLVGPSVTGNRTVGGYDSQFFGQPINPETAELSTSGQVLSAEMLAQPFTPRWHRPHTICAWRVPFVRHPSMMIRMGCLLVPLGGMRRRQRCIL